MDMKQEKQKREINTSRIAKIAKMSLEEREKLGMEYLTTGKELKSTGKKFYKILPADMNLYQIQYKLGLNENFVHPFSPVPTHGNGITFNDEEQILSDLDEGTLIAEIDIPDDEIIVVLKNTYGSVYKSSKIIIKNIKKISELSDKELEMFINYFNETDIDSEWLTGYTVFAELSKTHQAFRMALLNNFDNVVSWMLKRKENIKLNIHISDDIYLSHAASGSSPKIIEMLLKEGLNIHSQNDRALIHAVFANKLNNIKCLVEHGADVNAQNNKAIIEASGYGYLDIIEYLMAHGARLDKMVLHKAILGNRWDVVKYFFEKGMTYNDIPHNCWKEKLWNKAPMSLIEYILEKENKTNKTNAYILIKSSIKYCKCRTDILKMILEKKYCTAKSMLRMAAKENLFEVVKVCVENGANVHTFNEYPLRQAMKNKNELMKLFLIENGADVEKVLSYEGLINKIN